MSNKRILITVVICYILGSVIFLMPFPVKLVNIIIYLPVCLAAAACLVKSNFKANAKKDVSISNLKRELAKLNLELHVTSNQIWAVSEQLQINKDENNGFAQQVYAQTEEMANLNTMLNEKMHETLMGVREMIRLLEESRSTTLELESLGINSETILETSKSEILEIVSIIREIEATFRITAGYMDRLSDTSRDIVGIL